MNKLFVFFDLKILCTLTIFSFFVALVYDSCSHKDEIKQTEESINLKENILFSSKEVDSKEYFLNIKQEGDFFITSGFKKQEKGDLYDYWGYFENRGYENVLVEIFTDSGGSETKLAEYEIQSRTYFWWFPPDSIGYFPVKREFIFRFFECPKVEGVKPIREEIIVASLSIPLR